MRDPLQPLTLQEKAQLILDRIDQAKADYHDGKIKRSQYDQRIEKLNTQFTNLQK